MDPFSDMKDNLNCVLFKSTWVFDNEFMKYNDYVVKSVVQSSKKR